MARVGPSKVGDIGGWRRRRGGLALAVAVAVLSCGAPGDGEGAGTGGAATTRDMTTAVTAEEPSTGGVASASTASTGAAETDTDATTGAAPACRPRLCGGELLECGDCLDNDSDGRIDLADVECTSPCDALEGSFGTGVCCGDADPCRQDCHFDGNWGPGDDSCVKDLRCDAESPGGPWCPFQVDFMACPGPQEAACVAACATPNGCDCFGCCTLDVGGVAMDIYLGAENTGDAACSLANLAACAACTKDPSCENPCDPATCEVCFGSTDVPVGCAAPSCADRVPCTIGPMGGDGCPPGFYCITGCCSPDPP